MAIFSIRLLASLGYLGTSDAEKYGRLLDDSHVFCLFDSAFIKNLDGSPHFTVEELMRSGGQILTVADAKMKVANGEPAEAEISSISARLKLSKGGVLVHLDSLLNLARIHRLEQGDLLWQTYLDSG